MLGEVVEYISEVHEPTVSYISIKLDRKAIESVSRCSLCCTPCRSHVPFLPQLHLGIDAETVRRAILKHAGAGIGSIVRSLKERHVNLNMENRYKLRVLPPELRARGAASRFGPLHGGKGIYFALQQLKAVLPSIIVQVRISLVSRALLTTTVCAQGISSVSRAVINHGVPEMLKKEKKTKEVSSDKKQYHLLVEGYGLLEVMGCSGVDASKTYSNHIFEVCTA
jgi:hypothetical protein